MKRIASFILLVLICTTGFAQTNKRIYTSTEKAEIEKAQIKSDPTLSAQAKANAKALKSFSKKIQAAKDSAAFIEGVNALEKLDFVLEADKLTDKYGNIAFVTSTTNFISVRDDHASVQISPALGGGPNGVGGITLDGKASNIKMYTNKKGNITYTFDVQGVAISANIMIFINKGSGEAQAVINPTFSANRITLSGILLPSEKSKVFKGSSI